MKFHINQSFFKKFNGHNRIPNGIIEKVMVEFFNNFSIESDYEPYFTFSQDVPVDTADGLTTVSRGLPKGLPQGLQRKPRQTLEQGLTQCVLAKETKDLLSIDWSTQSEGFFVNVYDHKIVIFKKQDSMVIYINPDNITNTAADYASWLS